ncbi:MAG: hypothetical protein V7K90_08250 [Nostoc sp.]|uniref:hypothetical protein n=1 Tax=Nostoc sp. TaxID=1180 RepID=UPI002FF584F6
MTEPFLLDFSIGLLLCISLCIFYEFTIIFYVMMHIHLTFLAFFISIFINFWGTLSELLINPWSIVGYLIPFIVQISFAAICVILRANLNKFTVLQDVIIVCVTPAAIVSLAFVFPNLQKLVSSAAKFNVYNGFNILGLISNTFILILGGLLGFSIQNMMWQSHQ